MPKVSIITASYNYEDYIKETIESVLAQTYTDWEMIIVDDGSKDNSLEVIESYCKKDERIKLFTHKNNVNKGLVKTLRLGIEKAQSDWIIFLESDDTITPNYLEEKINYLNETPDAEFIYNDVNLFGDKERIEFLQNLYFSNLYKILEKYQDKEYIKKTILSLNIVPTFSVVMLKKELLIGLKDDPKIKQWLDYYWWIQISLKTYLHYIPKKLTNWRIHKQSYNSKKDNPYDVAYFCDKQVADLLSCGKHKFAHNIKLLFSYFRAFKRQFIELHFNDNEIILMGKVYKIPFRSVKSE